MTVKEAGRRMWHSWSITRTFTTKNCDLHAEKICYFSDDAASQYKSTKNFLNLCHHQDDFGVKADWLLHMEMGHVMIWVEQ